MSTPSRSLVRRALHDHRRLVVPLALLLAADVLVLAVYVYPLWTRVTNASALTAAAEAELGAARVQHAQATALATAPARSASRLDSFYNDVLPRSFTDARLLAVPKLEQIARKAGVRTGEIDSEVEQERDRTLTRLAIEMDVRGTYAAIRRFIHELERAPEFVVIENIRIAQQGTDEEQLALNLELSTYFKGAAP